MTYLVASHDSFPAEVGDLPDPCGKTTCLDQSAGNRLVQQSAEVLSAAGSPTPRLDARVLFCSALGIRVEELYTRDCLDITDCQLTRFHSLIERRTRGEPVAYLVGHKEFMSLDFLVDDRVLIPRPETEHLVDEAIRFARTKSLAGEGLVFADVGTGSGAIAVSVARELPAARIYALDISEEALQVASANVWRHRVESQVQLVKSDLLASLPERVHAIFANLPYTVLDELADGVRNYEPHLALDGGAQGLDVYRRLLAQTPHYLGPGGGIFMEIDPRQADEMIRLAQDAFPSAKVWTVQDLSGGDRLVALAVDEEADGRGTGTC